MIIFGVYTDPNKAHNLLEAYTCKLDIFNEEMLLTHSLVNITYPSVKGIQMNLSNSNSSSVEVSTEENCRK